MRTADTHPRVSLVGRVRRGGIVIHVLASVAVTTDALAQATPSVQMRADNDGFDFWKRPARRTDGEYTNGVQISVETARAPLWRRFARRSPSCADVPDGIPRCSSARVVIGQDMYTPAEDSQPYTFDGWRHQRPYAGWLYGSFTVRDVRRSAVRSLGVTLGVTGPPSFADQAQREAHRLMARYTSTPIGWETQLRFEPGIILSASQQWMLFTAKVKRVRLMDASVGLGASAGNILTNAEANGRIRAGINLSHPWRRDRRRGPAELVGSLGGRAQLVARNIFLDGNTLHPDRRVKKIPGVADVNGLVGLRLGPVVLAYAVTQRGREYRTGPRSHTFGSLVAGIGGTPDLVP